MKIYFIIIKYILPLAKARNMWLFESMKIMELCWKLNTLWNGSSRRMAAIKLDLFVHFCFSVQWNDIENYSKWNWKIKSDIKYCWGPFFLYAIHFCEVYTHYCMKIWNNVFILFAFDSIVFKIQCIIWKK